jgi:hypothetical protein
MASDIVTTQKGWYQATLLQEDKTPQITPLLQQCIPHLAQQWKNTFACLKSLYTHILPSFLPSFHVSNHVSNQNETSLYIMGPTETHILQVLNLHSTGALTSQI